MIVYYLMMVVVVICLTRFVGSETKVTSTVLKKWTLISSDLKVSKYLRIIIIIIADY